MDAIYRFTFWERDFTNSGWGVSMSYTDKEEAVRAMEAFEEDFYAEHGVYPVEGRDFLLTLRLYPGREMAPEPKVVPVSASASAYRTA